MRLILLLSFIAPLAAQSIDGDVVDAVTGAPIVGAHIVSRMSGDPEMVTTDRSGHFRMTWHSVYAITVSMPGYLRAERSFNQTGRSLPRTSNLRIELTPQAVITGAIEDEDGFPVVNARILAMQYRIFNGERRLNSAGSCQADDRGRYRITQLPAGKYYLQVQPQELSQWDSRYITQFRGSPIPDDDQRVEVKTGEERKIDLRIMKFEGVTVSGRIERPGATVTTHPPSISLVSDALFLTPRPAGNGTFTFQHVPPGTYTLRVTDTIGVMPAAGDLFAEQKLKVESSDIRNLSVVVHTVAPFEIAGKVTFESGTPPERVQVRLTASNAQRTQVETNPDGSFLFKDILPGHYSVDAVPAALSTGIPDTQIAALQRTLAMPSSIRLGSNDVTEHGFDVKEKPAQSLEISLTSATGSLQALVLDANGHPAPGVTILLQRTTRGRTTAGFTEDSGTAALSHIVPGEYKLFVLPNRDGVPTLNDPDWLAAHDKDYPPVRIVAGENPAITLKIH